MPKPQKRRKQKPSAKSAVKAISEAEVARLIDEAATKTEIKRLKDEIGNLTKLLAECTRRS